jgi:riboflavin transporter FmnP
MKKLVYSAMCLALCLVLPFLTGQIPEIGSMLLPMHIPVLLCGFLCGGGWGAVVGFTAPLLRHLIFSMPPMPGCISMALELAVYGLITGVLYRKLGKGTRNLYISLLCAMVAGRLVWGAAQMVILGLNGGSFPLSAFVAGALTGAIPGIVLQLVLIPLLVRALDKAKIKA